MRSGLRIAVISSSSLESSILIDPIPSSERTTCFFMGWDGPKIPLPPPSERNWSFWKARRIVNAHAHALSRCGAQPIDDAFDHDFDMLRTGDLLDTGLGPGH